MSELEASEMEAGYDLDVRIATEVLGWTQRVAKSQNPRSQKHWYRPGSNHPIVLPSFSWHIAAAWLIVEHLRARGIWLEELTGRYETAYRAGFMWRGDHPFSPHYVQEMADTAPLAICLAALAASSAEEGEN